LYIPGYGNVLTADFTKPPDPNKMAPAPVTSVAKATAKAAAPKGTGSAFLTPDQVFLIGGGPSLIDGTLNPANIPAPVKSTGTTTKTTGAAVTDTGTGGSTATRPITPYPTTLPPLSPEMLAAIEARRRAANRGLLETEAQVESRRTQAELENIGRLLGIGEQAGRTRRSGMQELAGRGVARSPMYANPFRREVARVQQEQIGLSQQQLAGTLDQLQAALQSARQRRESELAQIAFDEAMARSDVNRLLGV
jgi:hypothetical protein